MSEYRTETPVAVVTGASSGFGEQIVRNLADWGWYTIGVARREARLQQLASEVHGGYAVCDIADPEQINETTENILSSYPEINVLVNSAGMPLRQRYEDADADEMKSLMTTNYLGSHLMTMALLPGLEAARPADVVNIVSAAATIANPSSGPYGASKAAQLNLSRCQAVDLSRHGVRVHAVLPGKADTEGHPMTLSSSPLSRLITTDVETVAEVVVGRIGKKPRERYVPRILKPIAVLNTLMPVATGRVVNKLIK